MARELVLSRQGAAVPGSGGGKKRWWLVTSDEDAQTIINLYPAELAVAVRVRENLSSQTTRDLTIWTNGAGGGDWNDLAEFINGWQVLFIVPAHVVASSAGQRGCAEIAASLKARGAQVRQVTLRNGEFLGQYDDLDWIIETGVRPGEEALVGNGLTLPPTLPAGWAGDLLKGALINGRIDVQLLDEVLSYSDVRTARLLEERWNGELTCSSQTRVWRIWNGRTHAEDDDGAVEKSLHEYADALSDALAWVRTTTLELIEQLPDREDELRDIYYDRLKKHRAYRDRLYSDQGQTAVFNQLRKRVTVDESKFDASTRWLVAGNGVLDLDEVERTGEFQLYEHSPERHVTMSTPVDVDMNAKAPHFLHYLETSLPDPHVRRYLQRWIGSSLLGKPKDKGLINLIGDADSGKSVLLKALQRIGGSYAKWIGIETFLASQNKDKFIAYSLRGVRIAVSGEPGEGRRLDDSLIKAITGGDQQSTRPAYGRKEIEWVPQATIFIASNHEMRLDTGDAAMLSRLKPIKFPRSFSRDQDAPIEVRADLKLGDKIAAELPGVLAWALEGLKQYIGNGLGPEPMSVFQKREEMAENIDPPLEWIADTIDEGRLVVIAPGDAPASRCVKASDLYSLYTGDQMATGNREIYSQRRFGSVIARRYGGTQKSAGVRYVGLLKPDVAQELDLM